MNNNEDYARYMYGYYHPIRTPSIDTPSIGTGIKREKENLLPEEKYHSNTTDNNNIYAKDNLNLDFNPNYVGPDFNEIVYDTMLVQMVQMEVVKEKLLKVIQQKK